jgi:hypothetical protein
LVAILDITCCWWQSWISLAAESVLFVDLLQADIADAYAKTRSGRSNVRSFAADPSIFPCQLSDGTLAAARAAVKAAAASWGERSLELLEAEDRLSVACEKGTTEDQVLLKLRAVYQVHAGA